jgi:hypothetical protein
MTKAAELAKMGEVLTNSQLGGRRNMIINGAMQVAQRGTSQASITSTGYYTIDRWQVAITNGGTWTMSQDTDVPTGEGFANSLKMDCTTADTSFGASDSLYVRTKLESQDCQNMKKGTSSAEKVTLRFWVKSSKTGTHIVELLDNDNSRFVSLAYTISSADTWENHTLTFPADTTGAFADDNGVGLGIHWYMGAGSNISSGTLGTTWHTTQANRAAGQVNLADSTDNNWYLTGVQLEIGEQATPFEHRSFGEELRLCQRYFTTSYPDGTAIGNAYGSAAGLVYYRASDNNFGMSSTSQFFPVTMRASPTITIYSTKTGTSGSVTTEFTGTEYGSAVGGNITNKYFTPSDGSTAVSSNVRVSYEYTADGEL